MWWLFLSSQGAASRVQIVRILHEEPMNAHQISDLVRMHYMTIRHHLSVLENNHMIETGGNPYGQLYFLSSNLESRWTEFEVISAKARNRERESK